MSKGPGCGSLLPVAAAGLILAVPGLAADAIEATGTGAAGDVTATFPVDLDTLWVLLAGVLVMFMQCGFVMVETGFTRAKNVCNVAMKGVMDFCLAGLS